MYLMSIFINDMSWSELESDSESESDQQIEYVATPAEGKSSYETEQWITTLKNGKFAMFEITTFFRYGEFTLYLTDAEKKEVLALDEVVLTDWNCEFICNNDGFCKNVDIPNKNKYTPNELEEISKSVHVCNKSDHSRESDINECGDDAETYLGVGCFYDETLQQNGWTLDETIYGFQCKCDLTNAVAIEFEVEVEVEVEVEEEEEELANMV